MIHTSGVQHVGIPVTSLPVSLRFYKKVFGVDPDFVATGSGDELSRALRVPAAVLSFAFLRIGDARVELLEYTHPRGNPYDRRNCDAGAIHIAFRVSNLDIAYSRLVREGLVFNAPPIRISDGPLAGCAFAYFSDPDGVQLELFEEPPS